MQNVSDRGDVATLSGTSDSHLRESITMNSTWSELHSDKSGGFEDTQLLHFLPRKNQTARHV